MEQLGSFIFEDFFKICVQIQALTSRITDALHEGIQWRTQEFFSWGGGVQQIQLRSEDSENVDLET